MKARFIPLLLWLALFFPLGASCADSGVIPTVSTSGEWHPGKFVWADLVTHDLDTAKHFYGQLLGWAFHPVDLPGRHYEIAFNQDKPVGGLLQAPNRKDVKGHPRWIGYLSVTEMGQALQSAIMNGGKILLAPKNLPARGEQAILRDPQGAVFGIMKTSQGDPEDFLAEPGDWIWMQLLSRDADQAGSFYRSLADYSLLANSTSPFPDSLVLVADGYARATVMQIPQDRPSLQPAWLPFVRVTDIDGALRQTSALGGRVLLHPKPDLLSGHLAVIADPTGAVMGLIQWDQNETREEQ